MKRILLTGGSGFIGTNLLDHLIELEYDVLNIDINPPKNSEHLKHWINCDITFYDEFEIHIKNYKPNYIIHLAARTDLKGKSINDYKANTKGVENLILISRNIKSLKKIIVTSSMLVNKNRYIPKHFKDYNPDTIYGKSKVITEQIVWENLPKIDWCIIRPTSIWGPWFSIPYLQFFKMIINNNYFHIGDSKCIKTFGFVGNSVYQIEKLLNFDTTSEKNKILYIGDYYPLNIKDWANEIANESNSKVFKLPSLLFRFLSYFGDFLKYFGVSFVMDSYRYNNMTNDYIIDLSKTEAIVGKLPFTTTEGVKKTLIWIDKT